MVSHADCSHENTKAARDACRRAAAGQPARTPRAPRDPNAPRTPRAPRATRPTPVQTPPPAAPSPSAPAPAAEPVKEPKRKRFGII